MKQTIRDFWQMVWEQNTYTVIMLCMLSQTVTEDDSVNEIVSGIDFFLVSYST